ALDDLRAALPSVRHRGLEHPHRQPLPAKGARDEQARHRPNRRVVEALEDARALQSRAALARRDGAPCDRTVAHIAEQPRLHARLDERPEIAPIRLTLLVIERGAGQPPPHAPAATTGPARPEQGFEIQPARGYQGIDGEFWQTRHINVLLLQIERRARYPEA